MSNLNARTHTNTDSRCSTGEWASLHPHIRIDTKTTEHQKPNQVQSDVYTSAQEVTGFQFKPDLLLLRSQTTAHLFLKWLWLQTFLTECELTAVTVPPTDKLFKLHQLKRATSLHFDNDCHYWKSAFITERNPTLDVDDIILVISHLFRIILFVKLCCKQWVARLLTKVAPCGVTNPRLENTVMILYDDPVE